MKGETSRLAAISANNSLRSLPPAAADSHSPSVSTQPVRDRAPLMMNRQAMVIGALLPNTPTTSRALSTPLASRTATAAIAATSGLSHSRTKATNSTTRTRPTKGAARVSGKSMVAVRRYRASKLTASLMTVLDQKVDYLFIRVQ